MASTIYQLKVEVAASLPKIWRRLTVEGFTDLIGATSTELDLKDRDAVFAFFARTKPRYVVLAAAKVGGILANNTYPVDFLSENLRIQVNVLDAAREHGVERVLFLGSSCIDPKLAPQPLKEEYLLTGHLEPTNDAYAIAKIAGILQIQAVRRQHGLPWISAMPTNLYGPGDNFSPTGSHVLPAMIRRYEEARLAGAESVTNWGTGSPLREFLHVDDMAEACLHLLEHYDGDEHVNVGTGTLDRQPWIPVVDAFMEAMSAPVIPATGRRLDVRENVRFGLSVRRVARAHDERRLALEASGPVGLVAGADVDGREAARVAGEPRRREDVRRREAQVAGQRLERLDAEDLERRDDPERPRWHP